jgi:hypothetical protein
MGVAARVGLSPNLGGAPAVRVTRALDALRQRREDEPACTLEEPAGPVVIGSDFDVLAYPPLAARTLLMLDTCCEPNGSGIVARYQLSRAGLVRARGAGWDAGETHRRLTELAGALPHNVSVTLNDWERLADRVRLRTDVAILQVRIPRLLETLAADASLGRALVRRLSPTSALILDDQAGAIRQWLLRRGEFPGRTSSVEE